jgi:acyl dehydratase
MVTLANGPDELKALEGVELPPSSWLEIDQERIDAFAAVTGDTQWIHVDSERAAQGPFGRTIAHGFLTLSLVPHFRQEIISIDGFRLTVNYGLDRVRFPAPVPVGSRLRAHFQFARIDEIEGGFHTVTLVTIEREGEARPVCVAELVVRYYF